MVGRRWDRDVRFGCSAWLTNTDGTNIFTWSWKMRLELPCTSKGLEQV